jgi:hypothetical protein
VRHTDGVEAADFVVDATGRGSRLSAWLEEGGWPRPELERLEVDVRYLSARFRSSPDWREPQTSICRYSPFFDSKGLAVAAVSAIENQQWTVMLAYFGSPDGDFVARCRELPPIFREAVSGEQVGEVIPYRHPDSRWRHFEALDRFPARHFFDLQKVIVESAWQTSTAGDAARLGLTKPRDGRGTPAGVGHATDTRGRRTGPARRHRLPRRGVHDGPPGDAVRARPGAPGRPPQRRAGRGDPPHVRRLATIVRCLLVSLAQANVHAPTLSIGSTGSGVWCDDYPPPAQRNVIVATAPAGRS